MHWFTYETGLIFIKKTLEILKNPQKLKIYMNFLILITHLSKISALQIHTWEIKTSILASLQEISEKS